MKERTIARLNSLFCWATLFSAVFFNVKPYQEDTVEEIFYLSYYLALTFFTFESRFQCTNLSVDVGIKDNQTNDGDYPWRQKDQIISKKESKDKLRLANWM